MLTPPDLSEATLLSVIRDAYGLPFRRAEFLPLGADQSCAVYRLLDIEGQAHFLKLRRSALEEQTASLAKWLSNAGVGQILAPIPTVDGRLWIRLDDWTLVLFPFVPGLNAYERPPTDRHLAELGMALHCLHTLTLSPELVGHLRREDYAPQGRQTVRRYLRLVETDSGPDSLSAELAAFLQDRRTQVQELVGRAERLAQLLRTKPRPFVLCHADLHAGNLHLADGGELYLVDWDEALLAPKERDLMVVGSGLLGGWRTPAEEERPFFAGYGPAEVDAPTLAYYRYERIVLDLAVECTLIWEGGRSGPERVQALRWLQSNFLPHNTIELAFQGDRS